MSVHHRVTPSIKFAGTHLYIWVQRGTVRVKCLAHEHNTMSLARARTRTARSGDKLVTNFDIFALLESKHDGQLLNEILVYSKDITDPEFRNFEGMGNFSNDYCCP